MDPLSHSLLGASLAQSITHKKHIVIAGVLAALAAMAPDLDILIRSSSDPLLYLEYHRQFTHSLIFIPVGSFICALVLYYLFAKRYGLSLMRSWWYCALGYATHALLDACTTYGTQLLWPFSNARFAWNTVSIIDPLFTLPILALVITAGIKKRPLFARLALAWAIAYLAFGMIQRDRAIAAGWELAAERQHEPVRLEAKPSFGNVILWKIVYETDDHYHIDAVRIVADSTVHPGERVEKLNIDHHLPWLDRQSQQAKDIERFRWFSNGYIAKDPHHPHRLIDVRYSTIPNEVNALWSIELSPEATHTQHIDFVTNRTASKDHWRTLMVMLLYPRGH